MVAVAVKEALTCNFSILRLEVGEKVICGSVEAAKGVGVEHTWREKRRRFCSLDNWL